MRELATDDREPSTLRVPAQFQCRRRPSEEVSRKLVCNSFHHLRMLRLNGSASASFEIIDACSDARGHDSSRGEVRKGLLLKLL